METRRVYRGGHLLICGKATTMNASGSQAGACSVHLVGSVPLNSAEEVFRRVTGSLGPRIRRLPDGETGDRTGWVGFQVPVLLARLASRVAGGLQRPLNWVHMPVPRDRDDDAYFTPLRELHLPAGTELFLGLVHATDGMDGLQRRAAAAQRFSPAFGIATECGFGRRPAQTVPPCWNCTAPRPTT
jgi:hypothetical protein